MDIKSVLFIKSSADLASCPKPGLPEYAFAGRSNVGKSSLLNLLVGIKNLAKTSSSPGKTRLINHFQVNEQWFLVDLPGYGYARAGKKTRSQFLSLIEQYVMQRFTLSCLFILIDSRHEPLNSDMDFIHWCGSNEIPFALVFTKTDKLSSVKLTHHVQKYRNILTESWEELPQIFLTSAREKTGRDELLSFVEQCNKRFTACL
jgi:GTP-binding protein